MPISTNDLLMIQNLNTNTKKKIKNMVHIIQCVSRDFGLDSCELDL